MQHSRYATTEKRLGETPLEAAERLRAELGLSKDVPLAYAGRLDPMATGTLLILIGDECKVQTKYHGLDKQYEVELLLGVRSDSGDVLGIVEACGAPEVSFVRAAEAARALRGTITLPYPHFSSKTVQGKPLHVWAVEKRLGEIEIPTKQSRVYTITPHSLTTISKSDLFTRVRTRVDSIPEVTDPRKHLGADFRRTDVRASWSAIEQSIADTFQILSFTCIASSGTYMRSLSEHLAKSLGTCGLALSIHRSRIGTYQPLIGSLGFWTKRF